MDDSDPIARVRSSRRILVLGSSGSGKTTFSISLGRLLGCKIVHLDAHFWQPGWAATPAAQWRSVVAELVEQDHWIMDGTYESSLDLRIPRADSIILIERSRWTCLWRVLQRKATWDDQSRCDAPPGQKLDRAFLGYVWRYPVRTHPAVLESIGQYGAGKTVIQLRGSRQVEQFLSDLRPEAGRAIGGD